MYIFIYIYIYIYLYHHIQNYHRRLGVVSSSLDQPFIRKSISIALAFALGACVRSKLRGRKMLPVWLGVAGCNLSMDRPTHRPAGILGAAGPVQKPLPCFWRESC